MRKLRITFDGVTYHVSSKIDHDDMAFEEAGIKELFLEFVRKAKEKFDFKLWDFVVMSNHIHFLIKPGKGVSLSKIMQWLKCNFAKKWNKVQGTKGHLWGERFFSRIIKDERDYERVTEYIDENPVKAQMVKEAKSWPFGGLFYKLKGIKGIVDDLLGDDLVYPGCAPAG